MIQKISSNLNAKLEILLNQKDSNGNYLLFHNDTLYIRQTNEERNRNIGKLFFVNNKLLYFKHEDESMVFRKTDAWSIPVLVVNSVDVILYRTKKRDYWITSDNVKSKGLILSFPNMEKKYYVERKHWCENMFTNNQLSDINMDVNDSQRKVINHIGINWFSVIGDEFEKDYMRNISTNLNIAISNGKIIYPDKKDIFKAFRLTPFNNVKIIILGQDPYFDGNATGIAFDCKNYPSSSITKIVEENNKQFPNGFTTDLYDGRTEHWTRQGIFMFNSSLTVRRNEPNSHAHIWKPFTERVLSELSNDPRIKCFVLWGSKSQSFKNLISDKHVIIEAEHPAAAAREKREWNSNQSFIKMNEFMQKYYNAQIEW